MISDVEGRTIQWFFVLWEENRNSKATMSVNEASSKCRGSMSAAAVTLDVCPSYPAPPPDDKASLGTVRVSTPHMSPRSSAWPGQSFLGGHTVPSMAGGPSSMCGPGLPALSWTCCVHEPPSQLSCEPLSPLWRVKPVWLGYTASRSWRNKQLQVNPCFMAQLPVLTWSDKPAHLVLIILPPFSPRFLHIKSSVYILLPLKPPQTLGSAPCFLPMASRFIWKELDAKRFPFPVLPPGIASYFLSLISALIFTSRLIFVVWNFLAMESVFFLTFGKPSFAYLPSHICPLLGKSCPGRQALCFIFDWSTFALQCWCLPYSKVNWLCVYVCLLLFIFPSHSCHQGAVSGVPCAVQ